MAHGQHTVCTKTQHNDAEDDLRGAQAHNDSWSNHFRYVYCVIDGRRGLRSMVEDQYRRVCSGEKLEKPATQQLPCPLCLRNARLSHDAVASTAFPGKSETTSP